MRDSHRDMVEKQVGGAWGCVCGSPLLHTVCEYGCMHPSLPCLALNRSNRQQAALGPAALRLPPPHCTHMRRACAPTTSIVSSATWGPRCWRWACSRWGWWVGGSGHGRQRERRTQGVHRGEGWMQVGPSCSAGIGHAPFCRGSFGGVDPACAPTPLPSLAGRD